MIKIGEMAKICNVSIQTLRYYDKIGLLQADYVDSASGYRFYFPEKIKLDQTILHLKQLTFSLEETKAFLMASPEQRLKLYEQKKIRLQSDISSNQEKIQEIDRACIALSSGRSVPQSKILQLPFSDDPKVIGKWTLCGKLPSKTEFSPEVLLPAEEILFRDLFFLPGGGHVWGYCWTKNILYVTLEDRNISVPNEYRIFVYNGESYLLLNWMVEKCISPDAQDCTLVYRQVDQHPYTEKETFAFRDSVNLPFVADPSVLGHWYTVDLIDNLDDFNNTERTATPPPYFLQKISFYDRGICAKGFPKNRQKAYLYTKDFVLNRELELAERYWIMQRGGKEYLILEHKTGDYLYLGEVFCYYVFEKECKK